MFKKLAVLLLMASAPVAAFDTTHNPDAYASLGVDLIKMQQAGMPRAGIGNEVTNGQGVGFRTDYRLPVTNAFTFHAAAETESINNNLAYTDGYRLEIGGRVYFSGR